jgi:hypothetical protein
MDSPKNLVKLNQEFAAALSLLDKTISRRQGEAYVNYKHFWQDQLQDRIITEESDHFTASNPKISQRPGATMELWFNGPKQGLYRDWVLGEGGDITSFLARYKGMDETAAQEYLDNYREIEDR